MANSSAYVETAEFTVANIELTEGYQGRPFTTGSANGYSPGLLEDLASSTAAVPKKLHTSQASSVDIERKSYIEDEALFRFDFNDEQMAVEKLRDGISKFNVDAVALKDFLREKLA